MIAKARAVLLAAAVLVGGCATGPDFATVQSTIAPVPADSGRVYFYRTQLMGAAIQPTIHVNGQGVGKCQPGGVFYADLPAGRYEASVETEVERKLSFVLEPGEEKYVRCYMSFGVLVGRGHLELVPASTARGEIQDLSYTDPPAT